MEDGSELIEVCASCLMACCWHGELMCENSKQSGTLQKRRWQLDAMGLEHKSNYSAEKLKKLGIK